VICLAELVEDLADDDVGLITVSSTASQASMMFLVDE